MRAEDQDEPSQASDLQTEEGPSEENEQPAERTHKSGFDQKAVFGGPNSPEGAIEEDDRIKAPAFRWGGFDGLISPWFEWKKGVNERHGLQLTGHYVALYQGLSESLGEEDKAASAVFRLTASWAVVGRDKTDKGSLVVTFDHRHAFTDLAPAGLASQAGYLGVTGLLFSDIGSAVVNLNWQQSFHKRDIGLIAGRFDPNDYMNVLGYANPWTGFQNVAIVLEPSIAFPDSSWGVGAASWFNDQWWILGTVNDANGAVTDNLEFLPDGTELFSQVSFGWSPSKGERYTRAILSSVWHVDEREERGIEGAEGITLSANWTWNTKWMVFGRAGYSDGAAPIYNRSATAGFIRKFQFRSDLLGFGINWGDPPDHTLREQITIEGFYQIQIAQNLELTPSLQYLIDPAFNPEEDPVWVLGMRMRFTF